MSKTIKAQEFNEEIRDGVVVVDFFAKWCGPCKMLGPVIEELGNEMDGRVKFVKVDIDQSRELVGRYDIYSVPTIKVFKNGREVDTIVGFQPKNRLKARVNAQL